MIDCHLHLQDPRLLPRAGAIMERLRRAGVTALAVNGTCPGDWEDVAGLADRFPEVVPFFGLHPWRVAEAPAGWLETLDAFLERHPAAGVGEIGLDKWMRGHDIARQREVLLAQLELARRRRRPAAVHCLQAWGHLRDCFGEAGVRGGALLHSYGGPREMVGEFVGMGCWFSVSGWFFRKDKRDKLETFAAVPEERLLAETDAPDMAPPPELPEFVEARDDTGALCNHPANIAAVHRALAGWLGKPPGETARLVEANFRAWLASTVDGGAGGHCGDGRPPR